QERGPDPRIHQAIVARLFMHQDPLLRLRGLWALHATGGLGSQLVETALRDSDAHVRAWAVQFLCEQPPVEKSWLDRFGSMARSDPSPVVRLYLAAALQRLPVADRGAVVAALLEHAEDARDPNIPLMLWFATEPLAAQDPARALELGAAARIP